jgi:hypothetical protein
VRRGPTNVSPARGVVERAPRARAPRDTQPKMARERRQRDHGTGPRARRSARAPRASHSGEARAITRRAAARHLKEVEVVQRLAVAHAIMRTVSRRRALAFRSAAQRARALRSDIVALRGPARNATSALPPRQTPAPECRIRTSCSGNDSGGVGGNVPGRADQRERGERDKETASVRHFGCRNVCLRPCRISVCLLCRSRNLFAGGNV